MISHTTIAARVIADETAGLNALSKALNGPLGGQFEQAVDTILAAKGRVIVSGMGKSWHMARKIAATLASTGTPAHFVHPAEASHGDLGMMARGDIVLVLSISGETPELANLIAHTKRFAITLIGMAARADSSLMKQADIQLLLPSQPEACGHDIVPSTSTTQSVALGDALAIALMEARSFTPANFRDFHPGGKLGARLSRVRDLMHEGDELPLLAADTPMSETLLVMSQKGFGVVGVTDANGNLQGIVTDGDLRRNMDGLLTRTAGEVMTANPRTIGPDALAQEAVAVMNMKSPRILCLFVTDPAAQNRPIGILHIHDCLRAGLG
ncbi:MAG: KpsF/GutQ family sugar-phosphate isomerase [Rhodobacteraceae bacterium]|nr:KpsF/GutQ family sugar-phosphate isomerase [Paracoccaceae bacterium]